MPFRTYLPLISLMAGILVCLSLGLPMSIGLAAAVIVTLVAVNTLGISYRRQFAYGRDGVVQTKPVLLILFHVGLLIPLLMMGGTIPSIIYYGLGVVDVRYLLTIGFGLTAAVSYVLGTSVGTLSTIGLSLIGIAHAAQVPLGMMAGALISGAMVGERFSPVSSSRLLVISSIGGDEQIGRFANMTGQLTVGVTLALFFLLDLMRIGAATQAPIAAYQQLIQTHFAVSPVALVPLGVLIGSFVLRIRAIAALRLGILSAAALIWLSRPLEPGVVFRSMLFGYDLHSGTQLDALVKGGGLLAILQVLLLISLAGFMNGILNKANLLKPVVDRLMGKTDTVFSLVVKSVWLSLFVVVISCNQTIPILVLGATLQNRFDAFPGGRLLLGRTMLDAALVMPVLVPWNGLAMVMSVTLGVPTLTALPYMWFALLLPLVTIWFARLYRPAGFSTIECSR